MGDTSNRCSPLDHPVWGGLGETEAAQMARSCAHRPFRRRQEVYQQGEEPLGIYCVEAGHLLLRHCDTFGNETAFRVAMPGEFVGYRSFFAGEPHAVTAYALDTGSVCLFPRAALTRLFERHPAVVSKFLRMLARDPGPMYAPLLRSTYLPARVRLANLLVLLRERCAVRAANGGLTYELPLRRRDIAALLGTREETVARTVAAYHRDGLARFDGRRVEVPDADRLQAVAGAIERV